MIVSLITNKEIMDEVTKKYNGVHVFKMCNDIRIVLDTIYDVEEDKTQIKVMYKVMERYDEGFITKHDMYNQLLDITLNMDIPQCCFGYDFYEQWTFVDSLYNLFQIK